MSDLALGQLLSQTSVANGAGTPIDDAMKNIGAQAIVNNEIQKARDSAKDQALAANADPLEKTQSGVVPSLPGYTPSAILGNNGNSPSTLGWQKGLTGAGGASVGGAGGVDAITGATPMTSQSQIQVPPVANQAPVKAALSSAQPVANQSASQAVSPPSVTPQASDAQSKAKSILPLLMTLLQGGLETASAYYQRKGGDNGPTAQNIRLAREQRAGMQKFGIENQLKMQAIQYQQQRDMAALQNKYQIMYNQAKTDQDKQLIQAQYQADLGKMQAANDLTWKNFNRILGGQSAASALNQGAPDINQSTQLLGMSKVSP